MTLADYANLVEILAGAIVVVTLLFLIIQLRQNTHALKSTMRLGIQGTTISVYSLLSEDSMMQAVIKGMPRPSELTPLEKGKFNAFCTITLQNYQQTYYQIREGNYDQNLYDGWWQVLRDNFLSPGFQLHWKQRKFILSPEFRNYVEREVMSLQPTPGYAEAVAKR